MLKMPDLTRVKVPGPPEELEKLKAPLAHFKIQRGLRSKRRCRADQRLLRRNYWAEREASLFAQSVRYSLPLSMPRAPLNVAANLTPGEHRRVHVRIG